MTTDTKKIPAKLTDVTGNIRATVVIGDASCAVQIWDCGYKGSPDKPLLLAEQGWATSDEHRAMTNALVKEDEFVSKLCPDLQPEDDPEDEMLYEPVQELLRGMDILMRAFRNL